MRLADEGHHVVLAMGGERNVAHEHHVVVALDLLEHAVENVAGVLGDSRRTVRGRPSPRGRGVSSRPSRSGSSPAQASSMRTAASASSWLGRAGEDLAAGFQARIRGKVLTTASMWRLRGCFRYGQCTFAHRYDGLRGYADHARLYRGYIRPARAFRRREGFDSCSTTSTTSGFSNSRAISRGSAGWSGPAPRATAHSKLCGSTVTVDVSMDDGKVVDFAHDVKACALGQASSSIMARNVIGVDARRNCATCANRCGAC